MKHRLIALLMIFAVLFATPLLASDISNSDYYGTITVTNNGTAVSPVSVNVSGLNTADLISNHFLSSSANDCAIQSGGSDIPFMPGYDDNPWIVFLSSIGAYASDSVIAYMPNATDGKTVYFPGTTGMTTTDDDSWDNSDNFSYAFQGYINTAQVSANISSKKEAWRVWISASANISAGISNNVTATSTIDSTDNWTNDANAIDGNSGTFAFDAIPTTGWGEFLELAHTAMLTDSISYYCGGNVPGVITKINLDAYYDGNWHDVYEGNFTYTTWEEKQLDATHLVSSVRAKFYNSVAVLRHAYIYEMTYNGFLPSVTASMSSGEYKLEVYADSANLTIEIDDVIKDTVALGGASIPSNDEDFVDGDQDVTPYIEYVKRYSGGTLIQHTKWKYGTTFTDLSGNGNDATPSFRTTSSNADVSASLTAFNPVSQPTAPPYVVGSGADFISENITVTGNFATGNATLTYPGRAVIQAISNASATPSQFLETIIFTFVILAVSIAFSALMRRSGSGSIVIKIVILVTGFGIAVSLHVYDWWMLVFLFIFAVAAIYASNERISV